MVARVTHGWDVRLMFEPGRVIAGNAGVLLTRVIRVKRNGNRPPFIVVDAAMNDLARPALYGAWHDFEAVRPTGKRMTAHIVGPICETGDTFATRPRMRRARGRRSRRVPHRRSLRRNDGLELQQPRLRARSPGRRRQVRRRRRPHPAREIFAAERVPEWLA